MNDHPGFEGYLDGAWESGSISNKETVVSATDIGPGIHWSFIEGSSVIHWKFIHDSLLRAVIGITLKESDAIAAEA